MKAKHVRQLVCMAERDKSMLLRMDNAGIVVEDLPAAIAFFQSSAWSWKAGQRWKVSGAIRASA